MKHLLPLQLLFIGIAFHSCQREIPCDSCDEANKSPVAIAGADQTITLPDNSVLLDGAASSDADGSIAAYSWKQVSGALVAQLTNPQNAKATASQLQAGIFGFELTVTDNKGLTAKDTVQVTVLSTPVANRPPVACAGTDQVISLPNNAVTLNGNCSTDPNNNIASYSWNRISGPAGATFTAPNAAQTQITNLTGGIYQIELTVTNAAGLASKDTVEIKVFGGCSSENRPTVNIQLTPVGTFSAPREEATIAVVGNKILFAGGHHTVGSNKFLTKPSVDIYDVSNNTWYTAELSAARYGMAAVVVGTRVFFAGGLNHIDATTIENTVSANVDIYDAATNTWTVATLSESRGYISAAAAGNKVVFAGGLTANDMPSNKVDIYDISTNTWSTATISDARFRISAISINNKIYFASGETTWCCFPEGPSNAIDIYDATTNTWSVSSLQNVEGSLMGLAVGNKMYRVQGCTVEIHDVQNGSTSFESLSPPVGLSRGIVKRNNDLLFFTLYPDPATSYGQRHLKLDIYNLTTGAWSVGIVPQTPTYNPTIIAVNNNLYFVSGPTSNVGEFAQPYSLWKLDF